MQADLQPNAPISEAARFLVDTPLEQRLRPTVPLLRERFGLNVGDAIEAIREADRIRTGGRHDGKS